MRNLLLLVVFIPALHACSEISDPVIRDAYAALDGAYATDVKPADATYTQCAYKLIQSRHVVRCGVSFGGTELVQLGYWELERQGNSFAAYAMNGKALSALERITRQGSTSITAYPRAFGSGAGRQPFDIAVTSEAFK